VSVSLLSGTTEVPANGLLDFGRVGQGDLKDLRIRLRGTSASTTLITQVTITGSEFSVSDRPSLPISINATQPIDISIRFAAPAQASYSGILRISSTGVVNTTTVVTSISLAAISVGAPTFSVVSGCALTSGTPPNAGALDLGRANIGETKLCTLSLRNSSAQAMLISALGVSGAGFELSGARAPLSIGAGTSVEFSVRFPATAAGLYNGTLTVDTRTYSLAAIVVQAPLSTPILEFDRPTLQSGQQVRLSLRFPSAALSAASGLITMTFQPDPVGVTQDAALVFVSTGGRTVPFAIRPGDTQATLNGLPFATFQTGTTSGTVTFTISGVAQGITGDGVLKAAIPPAPVTFDSGLANVLPGSINILLIGFDNTYTTGPAVFTFYDRTGTVLASPFRVDFTPQFKQFYAQNAAGSTFRAAFAFPANGDVSRVGAVDVEMVNSTGKTTTHRLQFP
jgi:hypothetical protein